MSADNGKQGERTAVPPNFENERHLYTKRIESDKIERQKSHLLIKGETDIKKSVAFCIDLMFNKQYPYVKLSAISNNIDKAVFIAESLKRKVRNLHQLNALESFHFQEIYDPITPNAEHFTFSVDKYTSCLVIKLMRQAPSQTTAYGYQKPIESKFVSSKDPRDYIKQVLENAREPKKKQLMSQTRERDELCAEFEGNEGNQGVIEVEDYSESEGEGPHRHAPRAKRRYQDYSDEEEAEERCDAKHGFSSGQEERFRGRTFYRKNYRGKNARPDFGASLNENQPKEEEREDHSQVERHGGPHSRRPYNRQEFNSYPEKQDSRRGRPEWKTQGHSPRRNYEQPLHGYNADYLEESERRGDNRHQRRGGAWKDEQGRFQNREKPYQETRDQGRQGERFRDNKEGEYHEHEYKGREVADRQQNGWRKDRDFDQDDQNQYRKPRRQQDYEELSNNRHSKRGYQQDRDSQGYQDRYDNRDYKTSKARVHNDYSKEQQSEYHGQGRDEDNINDQTSQKQGRGGERRGRVGERGRGDKRPRGKPHSFNYEYIMKDPEPQTKNEPSEEQKPSRGNRGFQKRGSNVQSWRSSRGRKVPEYIKKEE